MDPQKIRNGIIQVLDGLGLNLNDPNLIDTPDRVTKSFQEILQGLVDTDRQVEEILSATFPCDHREVVIAKNIECFSLCPHHLLPVHYDVVVGYMPGGDGARVVGLSKLYRLVELLAKRPVLQEQMVNDISNALMRIPGCIGAGCIAYGEHHCIKMRGVAQKSAVVVSSSLQGAFMSESMVRSEFMQLARL